MVTFRSLSASSGWTLVARHVYTELVRRGTFIWVNTLHIANLEKDYYLTIYSAEIVNTLTNLLFIYLAAKGIHMCLTNGHDTVFLVAYVGYLLVGSGSFLFHATLKCASGRWDLILPSLTDRGQILCNSSTNFR